MSRRLHRAVRSSAARPGRAAGFRACEDSAKRPTPPAGGYRKIAALTRLKLARSTLRPLVTFTRTPMAASRLRVFVSSKMQELAPERREVKSALDELKVDGWVFEEDAGARPQSVRQTYTEELDGADLYIGLFWKEYGDYTVEEYERARSHGKDCL